jgi:hypothetical protein
MCLAGIINKEVININDVEMPIGGTYKVDVLKYKSSYLNYKGLFLNI